MTTIDTRKMGNFVAGAMETLERTYPDASLGEVLVICELGDQDEDGDESTVTALACTDGRHHIQLGLLHSALLRLEESA